MSQIIDMTGLSNEAVRAVETLVHLLRTNDAATSVKKNSEMATNGSEKPPEELSHEEWLIRWQAFLDSRRSSNPNMDDSRESIYEGRGE